MVQLYKDGAAHGDPVGTTDTAHDFTPVIQAAGSGSYTFTVKAIGDGISYGDGEEATVGEAYPYTPAIPPGIGTEGEPYQIFTAQQLLWFAGQVNTPGGKTDIHAVLEADITLNDTTGWQDWGADPPENLNEWTPIGSIFRPFQGSFDGNGHTITGIYIDNGDADYQGLFGVILNGKIQNVRVAHSYIGGGSYVSGVCGYNIQGTITNVYNSGTVAGSGTDIGGICGYNSGTIKGSRNDGAVRGQTNVSYRVGGICGVDGGVITDVYNAGTVHSGSYNVGGICGFSQGTLANAYNTGDVSGSSNIGGICGMQAAGSIENCYFLTPEQSAGIGHRLDGAATRIEGKTRAQFASGEVAWLLGDAFGQTLGSGGDPAPVFRTLVPGNAVFRLAYMLDAATMHAAQYYNAGNTVSAEGIEAAPPPEDHVFLGWDTLPLVMPDEDIAVMGVFGMKPTLAAIQNQTLEILNVGYAQEDRETKIITIARNTGLVTNLEVTLSGDDANSFHITQPEATTLDDDTLSTQFTISATDGLFAGTYTATVTVSATHMDDVTFTVTQQVLPDCTMTGVDAIADIYVANGTALAAVGLPAAAGVTLSDDTSAELDVTWDGGTPAYDGSTAGTYVFTGTLSLPADVTNPGSLTASVNVIVAEATVATYTISVSASPPEGGSVSGGEGTYAEGAKVTVTATANPGYSFVNWIEEGMIVSTKATYEITMGTADRTLAANFQAIVLTWPKNVKLCRCRQNVSD